MLTISYAHIRYFSTGSYEFSEFYHYGLALNAYTHFTYVINVLDTLVNLFIRSPIRRYADIIVHRQLWDSLHENTLPPIEHQELAELVEHINKKHRYFFFSPPHHIPNATLEIQS